MAIPVAISLPAPIDNLPQLGVNYMTISISPGMTSPWCQRTFVRDSIVG
jgi:hypothetical protein